MSIAIHDFCDAVGRILIISYTHTYLPHKRTCTHTHTYTHPHSPYTHIRTHTYTHTHTHTHTHNTHTHITHTHITHTYTQSHAHALSAIVEEHRKQPIQESKFLGGDMEHTHLVKGLDYALLQKVTQIGLALKDCFSDMSGGVGCRCAARSSCKPRRTRSFICWRKAGRGRELGWSLRRTLPSRLRWVRARRTHG